MVQNNFQQTNKNKINHINDNHIEFEFEVSLHFLGIWPTVRHTNSISNINAPCDPSPLLIWPWILKLLDFLSVLNLIFTVLPAKIQFEIDSNWIFQTRIFKIQVQGVGDYFKQIAWI